MTTTHLTEREARARLARVRHAHQQARRDHERARYLRRQGLTVAARSAEASAARWRQLATNLTCW